MVLLRSFFEISYGKCKISSNSGRIALNNRRKTAAFFAVALYDLFSANRVPGFIRLCFERAHISFYLHFEFSFEITWCSPRVPAGAASAIFESAGSEGFAGLIYYIKSRSRLPLAVLLDSAGVFFSGLTFDNKTDGNIKTADLYIGFD